MSKKRKLRKLMRKREVGDQLTLVICVGKKCADRATSRAVAEHAAAHADTLAAADPPRVRVETVGCLHVCKKGPIAATFPTIKFKKRVDAGRATRMIDKLAAKARRLHGA